MEPRLSFLTLGVRDLPRARAFYTDVLGWTEARQSNPHVAFFQLPGFVLALYGADALSEDAGVPLQEVGVPRVALACNVAARDDVDALLARLAARGVTITRPASDASWGGRTGYFQDPEGFLWEVAWNPGGQLGADGSFRLGP